MGDVLADAVERYRRERFLAEAAAAYASAPGPHDEDRVWEGTLADGLRDH